MQFIDSSKTQSEYCQNLQSYSDHHKTFSNENRPTHQMHSRKLKLRRCNCILIFNSYSEKAHLNEILMDINMRHTTSYH